MTLGGVPVAGSAGGCAMFRTQVLTVATGTFDTVTTAVPLCPSLVAVIVAEPTAPAVTTPLPFTIATAPLLDCQVMTRPVNGFPLASRGVAVSCAVCPTCTVGAAGLTVTAATGATQPATVTVAVSVVRSG